MKRARPVPTDAATLSSALSTATIDFADVHATDVVVDQLQVAQACEAIIAVAVLSLAPNPSPYTAMFVSPERALFVFTDEAVGAVQTKQAIVNH